MSVSSASSGQPMSKGIVSRRTSGGSGKASIKTSVHNRASGEKYSSRR